MHQLQSWPEISGNFTISCQVHDKMNHVKKLCVFIGRLIFLAKLEAHVAGTRWKFCLARQRKKIKHDRFFPSGFERQHCHENSPHTREICWANGHAWRWAQPYALVCRCLRSKDDRDWTPKFHYDDVVTQISVYCFWFVVTSYFPRNCFFALFILL